jgi:tetrahydromethanopterin:alpha-L-glutamate ligase
MMKIAIVGIPGKWSTELLADEVEKRSGYRRIIDMKTISYDSTKNTLFHQGQDLAELDAIIIKKVSEIYSPAMLDRLDLLALLEGQGVQIFSNPARIMQVVNRLSCTLRLGDGGIPMPETVVTQNIEEAKIALSKFGKAVLKPLYTSKARGMELVGADDEGIERLEEFQEDGNPIIYMQKFVKLPGKDLGLVFLGGEYVDTYARVSGGAWNTTTVSGGKYQPHKPEKEIIELARKAQALFNLDFTSVDVVETDEGPMVFEVSAFGGFRGLKESTGVNAAALYAEYVVNKLQANQ